MVMELQLKLAVRAYNPTIGFPHGGKSNITKNKRSFEEAFSDQSAGMMPLHVWSGQPNEEDDQKGQNKRASSPINENEEEKKLVVGWPPIQSWRKKLLHQHQHQRGQVGRIENNNPVTDGGSDSMYVKVKMEGVAIARKIDLKRYHSFYTLRNSLIAMFATYEKCNKPGVRYTLTYQDKEGDWLLAGDVPWQTFMESVQRLEIVKSGG